MRRISILGVLVLLAMVAAPAVSATPDLVASNIYPQHIFADLTNVLSVNVTNQGTAAGSCNVSLTITHTGGPTVLTGSVPALNDGEFAVVEVGNWKPDTVENITMTAFADCDGEVVEDTNEGNNNLTVSRNTTGNCSADDMLPDTCYGYRGDSPLSTVYEGTGKVIYSVGDFKYKNNTVNFSIGASGDENQVDGLTADVPGGATIKSATLYVYYCYRKSVSGPNPGADPRPDYEMSINGGGTLTTSEYYTFIKGFTTSEYQYGTLVYDVTSIVTGDGAYQAVRSNCNNTDPILKGKGYVSGMALMIIYDDYSDDTYRIAHGYDRLATYYKTQYKVLPEDATTTATLTDVDPALIASANLLTVTVDAVAPGSESQQFNSCPWDVGAWDCVAGVPTCNYHYPLGINRGDVTSCITASGVDEVVQFQERTSNGFGALNAILTMEEIPSNATVYFDPSDIRVPEYCNTETVGVWVNSSAALASGTIIFDYTFCCANVTDFAQDPVSFPGLSGEIIAATLTPGRVKIDFATGLLDGFPANTPVRLGNMTIHCCNPSDFCMTDLTWNGTDPEVNLMDAGDVAITPVKYEDGTFACNIPDLNVIELNPIGIDDTHYTVNCTIKNVGAASAGASYANLKVNDIEVATTLVPALAVDEETVCSFAPVMELIGGDADELMVCADYNDTVVELDEANNCKGAPYPGGVEIAIEFSPSHNITVAPGDEFIVNVTVEPRPGVEVYGVEYTLSFTPGVIFAEWQIEGDFLKQGGANTNVYIGEIDNVAGTLRFGVTRIDTPDGATDKGVLARIGFTALEQQGVCTGLNFTLVKVSDPEAEPIELEPDDLIDGWICTTNNTRPVSDAKSTFTYNNVGEIYISKAYFDGSASYDPEGGSITKYSWAFGDGQYGTGETIDHIYDMWKWNTTATPNCYDQFVVRLTVEDDGTPILDNATEILVNVYIAGDANGDGEVDIFDATIVGLEWDEECTSGSWAAGRKDQADLNNDCIVDIFDAVIVGANWDHTAWV